MTENIIRLLAHSNSTANFFTFGGRKYVNNALATADVLQRIKDVGLAVKNFEIKFKTPIKKQALIKFDLTEITGNFVGTFFAENTQIWFAYIEDEGDLPVRNLTAEDVFIETNLVTLCYYMASRCHLYVLAHHDNLFGERTDGEKSIFTKFEILDVKPILEMLEGPMPPRFVMGVPELITGRKFKLDIFVNEKLIGHRYNIIKALNL